MDIELNLTTNIKQNKNESKSKKKSSHSTNTTINFVKLPKLEGRTIAKRRKKIVNTSKATVFSFLKNKNDETESKTPSPKQPSKSLLIEKKENSEASAGLPLDSDLTINIKQSKPQHNKDKLQSLRSDRTVDTDISKKESNSEAKTKKVKQKTINRQENKKQNSESNTSQKIKNANAEDDLPTFRQISALFKNNPEIPKIGQRHVKPVTEKLFSGKHFTDLQIHPHSLANLEKNMNLKELTVVQQKAMPVILNGRDVLVRSQTGSGKTLTYALPIVEGLQALRPKLTRQSGIKALIIVPTRELALQTYELFIKLVKPFTWIVPGYLIGGEKRKAEKARIRKGFNILIATPGRICDHIKHTMSLKLRGVRCLILDEADRLLDMGYEKDVASVVQALDDPQVSADYNPLAMVRQGLGNKKHLHFDETNRETQAIHEISNVFLSDKRQTVLLSATLTKAVENLAGLTMKNPVFIDCSEDRGTIIADSIIKTPKESTQQDSDVPDDLEIVPQESENDSDVDSNVESDVDSSIDSDDDESSEDEKKKNAPVYKGLKAFNGISEKVKPKRKNKTKKVIEEHSDSDSDYDFFAAKKEADTKIVVDSGKHKNPFENALKKAVAQDEMVIPSSIDQVYVVVPMKLRLVTLSALIIDKCVKPGSGKMLVFMATQDMIDYHCELLSRVLSGKLPKKMNNDPKCIPKKNSTEEETEKEFKYEYDGIPLEVYEAKMKAEKAFVDVDFFQLHGSMDQKTRTDVFKTFRDAKSGVLLCTDVCARGVDLPAVECIVQYTGPISAVDYVHRVGRTARAGNVGTALMFLLPSEVLFVRDLEERRIRLRQREMEDILQILSEQSGPAATRRDSDKIAPTLLQQSLENLVEADKQLYLKACKAFTSWLRFYSTYPRESRAAFDRKAFHAGHAAGALALRAAPKQISKAAPKDNKEKPNNRLSNRDPSDTKHNNDNDKRKRLDFGEKSAAKRERKMIVSEFDSGLEPAKKKKK